MVAGGARGRGRAAAGAVRAGGAGVARARACGLLVGARRARDGRSGSRRGAIGASGARGAGGDGATHSTCQCPAIAYPQIAQRATQQVAQRACSYLAPALAEKVPTGQVAFLPKPSQYLPAGQSTQLTPERILPASQNTPDVTLPAAQYLPASQAWHPLILPFFGLLVICLWACCS